MPLSIFVCLMSIYIFLWKKMFIQVLCPFVKVFEFVVIVEL